MLEVYTIIKLSFFLVVSLGKKDALSYDQLTYHGVYAQPVHLILHLVLAVLL